MRITSFIKAKAIDPSSRKSNSPTRTLPLLLRVVLLVPPPLLHSRSLTHMYLVFLGLSAVDILDESDHRLAATAADVTAKGFSITMSTWLDSLIWSSEVTWIAFDSAFLNSAKGNYFFLLFVIYLIIYLVYFYVILLSPFFLFFSFLPKMDFSKGIALPKGDGHSRREDRVTGFMRATANVRYHNASVFLETLSTLQIPSLSSPPSTSSTKLMTELRPSLLKYPIQDSSSTLLHGVILGCVLPVIYVWCGVVWCGMVWCGVVWCGVV